MRALYASIDHVMPGSWFMWRWGNGLVLKLGAYRIIIRRV